MDKIKRIVAVIIAFTMMATFIYSCSTETQEIPPAEEEMQQDNNIDECPVPEIQDFDCADDSEQYDEYCIDQYDLLLARIMWNQDSYNTEDFYCGLFSPEYFPGDSISLNFYIFEEGSEDGYILNPEDLHASDYPIFICDITGEESEAVIIRPHDNGWFGQWVIYFDDWATGMIYVKDNKYSMPVNLDVPENGFSNDPYTLNIDTFISSFPFVPGRENVFYYILPDWVNAAHLQNEDIEIFTDTGEDSGVIPKLGSNYNYIKFAMSRPPRDYSRLWFEFVCANGEVFESFYNSLNSLRMIDGTFGFSTERVMSKDSFITYFTYDPDGSNQFYYILPDWLSTRGLRAQNIELTTNTFLGEDSISVSWSSNMRLIIIVLNEPPREYSRLRFALTNNYRGHIYGYIYLSDYIRIFEKE